MFVRRLVLALGALCVSSVGAMAADMPVKAPPVIPPPLYSWTGFYVGLNAGGAWGRSDASTDFFCPGPGFCPYNLAINLNAISAAGTGSAKSNSFTGGLLAGYNLQSGSFVFGGEVDIDALRIRPSTSVTAPIPSFAPTPFTETTSVEANWLATFRARVGFLVAPTVLVYGTGGLALTSLKVSNSYTSTALANAAGSSSTSATKAGWVVGGGLDWALNNNWIIRGEYLYVSFGSVSTTAGVDNVPPAGNVPDNLVTSANLRVSIARAALIYKF
jgi:outer membrane immunogenic protein